MNRLHRTLPLFVPVTCILFASQANAAGGGNHHATQNHGVTFMGAPVKPAPCTFKEFRQANQGIALNTLNHLYMNYKFNMRTTGVAHSPTPGVIGIMPIIPQTQLPVAGLPPSVITPTRASYALSAPTFEQPAALSNAESVSSNAISAKVSNPSLTSTPTVQSHAVNLNATLGTLLTSTTPPTTVPREQISLTTAGINATTVTPVDSLSLDLRPIEP